MALKGHIPCLKQGVSVLLLTIMKVHMGISSNCKRFTGTGKPLYHFQSSKCCYIHLFLKKKKRFQFFWMQTWYFYRCQFYDSNGLISVVETSELFISSE